MIIWWQNETRWYDTVSSLSYDYQAIQIFVMKYFITSIVLLVITNNWYILPFQRIKMHSVCIGNMAMTSVVSLTSRTSHCWTRDVHHCDVTWASKRLNHRKSTVYSTAYSAINNGNTQVSYYMPFRGEIHHWPIHSPHIGSLIRKALSYRESSCLGRLYTMLLPWCLVST